MTAAAHGDFESGGAVDLTTVGVYRYAEDQNTHIWMLAWALENGPEGLWHPGEAAPEALLVHVSAGGRFVGHNVPFERVMWNTALPRLGFSHWPRLKIEQCDCTMARALAVHLPASLDELGNVLGLPTRKDKEGHALMMKMARPRKIEVDGNLVWWNDSALTNRLGQYCIQDCAVEQLLDKKLPPLSADERALWELDQKINDRGICIDVATVERCVEVLEVAQERANARMKELTGGFVSKVTEAQRLVEWLAGRGLPCESIAKGEHEELKDYADCLGDETAKAVIDLRAEAGKAATAKYKRMLDMVCADGRVRGMFGYHRALTGRWGGSGIQLHNLARFEDETGDYLPDVLRGIEIMEMFG